MYKFITKENNPHILKNVEIINCDENDKILKIPEGIIEICSAAVVDNYIVEKIILPDSVKMIRNTAFYNCNKLKFINLNNSITIEKYAFYYYGALCGIAFSDDILKKYSRKYLVSDTMAHLESAYKELPENSNSAESGSFGSGFALGFLLGLIGLIIALCIGGNDRRKGAGAGFLTWMILDIIGLLIYMIIIFYY